MSGKDQQQQDLDDLLSPILSDSDNGIVSEIKLSFQPDVSKFNHENLSKDSNAAELLRDLEAMNVQNQALQQRLKQRSPKNGIIELNHHEGNQSPTYGNQLLNDQQNIVTHQSKSKKQSQHQIGNVNQQYVQQQNYQSQGQLPNNNDIINHENEFESYDQISSQKEILRNQIFSADILETLEEDSSDEENLGYNQYLMNKLSAKNRKINERNQNAQNLLRTIKTEEERKLMLRHFDEETLEDEYRRESRQYFGNRDAEAHNGNSSISPRKGKSSKHVTNSQINNKFGLINADQKNTTQNMENVNDINDSRFQNNSMMNNSQINQNPLQGITGQLGNNLVQGNAKNIVRVQQQGQKNWLHERYQTKIHKKTLHEFDFFLVQDIRAHYDSVWVAKFSPDGLYLATGGKDAVLKIWQVNQVTSSWKNQQDNPREYAKHVTACYSLFYSTPFREYREHEYDILDIAWCKNKPNLLLTCSFDCKVILWDLTKERHVEIFEHQEVPSKVAFNPDLDNLFVTGSLDKTMRLWSIDQKTIPLDTQQTQDYITAICFSQSGKKLVVGLSTGQCVIYSCDLLGKINYITRIDCKNRRGKFSAGRKVSGIQFLSHNEILIATNDSRLRLFNLEDCVQKYKYKGHKNENLQIEPSLSEDSNYIIMGSEDGSIYIWNKVSDQIPIINAPLTSNVIKNNRVKSYESLIPFDDPKIIAPVGIFAPEETLKIQQSKHQKIQPSNLQSSIKGILVACSIDGRLRVFINERLDGEIKEEEIEEDYFEDESDDKSPVQSEEDSDSDLESNSSPNQKEPPNKKNPTIVID